MLTTVNNRLTICNLWKSQCGNSKQGFSLIGSYYAITKNSKNIYKNDSFCIDIEFKIR